MKVKRNLIPNNGFKYHIGHHIEFIVVTWYAKFNLVEQDLERYIKFNTNKHIICQINHKCYYLSFFI